MGVPKFFRWLSERYPAISQLIAENRIPEFDNLYLDMNGIIHNCTHKDSDDATFRLSEQEMFLKIFSYIEHLFATIKPKKMFFMAIDGVAPRAKMNQQRARRFRTALDSEKAREKAIREGVEMPTEPPFDSNCITPGTEFMAKLTQNLKYFVAKKISEDKDWQGCDVVLSGHEVPGEGEHKIMEYIRNAKAQPEYDPNVRHCLYGLDADLIMLGLLSHDPHFCLLREEVTFGRSSKVKSKELEHQNFYLMHLCIVREYLELEFQDLKRDGAMPFAFDLERVIDDFILMAFFVGNDFLPNLPYLHINEGALATMFGIYKDILPKTDGYINEGGVINLHRLGLLLDELSKEEVRHFESENSDQKWLRGKQAVETSNEAAATAKTKGKIIMTSSQKESWKKIRKYVQKRPSGMLDLGTKLNAADRKFVQDAADDLHLEWRTTEDDDGHRHLVLSMPGKGQGEDDDDEEEEEGHLALLRVMKRYDNAQVVDVSADEAQAAMQTKYKEKLFDWKTKYYANKFEWVPESKESELRALCENYVQGLQWVLYYYYRGVASWPWYYASHYSPMISDVSKGFNADLNFKLGQPFRPFEQLMGVLPDRSKSIVPTIYHPLMTDPNSPIIDFYPRDFELDMNGKKMDWEAVVKIPFIDEKRLLTAMGPKNELLSDDEKARNDFGVSLKFTYDRDTDFTYPSPMVGAFPEVPHCKCIQNIYDLPVAEGLELYRGLMPGAKLTVEALAGFPSMATLAYNAALAFHGVKVFQQESRNQSMIVTLADVSLRSGVEYAKVKLGQKCFVGYPFLQEAKVIRVSDELFDYTLAENSSGQVVMAPHEGNAIRDWQRKADALEKFWGTRLGIIMGPVESMVHVEMLRGLVKTNDGALVKEYGYVPGAETDYPVQIIVDEVISEDQRFIEKAALPIEEEFPVGSKAFLLKGVAVDHVAGGDRPVYGRPVEVVGHQNSLAVVRTSLYFLAPGADDDARKKMLRFTSNETTFAKIAIQQYEREYKYWSLYSLADQLRVNRLVLSKITASLMVHTMGGSVRVNLGLDLKFEGKKQKVLGYSRKSASGWEFSPLAVGLIADYKTKFPEIFEAVKKIPQGKEISDTDIWNGQELATKKVKEVVAWIKEQGKTNFERVPLEAEQLDSLMVGTIEQKLDELVQNAPSPVVRKLVDLPSYALLRPEDAEYRLGQQTFGLGDRVMNAQDSGKVPICLKGIVVGISNIGSKPMLDVVFDSQFMGGSTLDGRCSGFRGLTVPANSVLNLSHPQLVVMNTKEQERRTTQPNQAAIRQSHGNNRGRTYHDAPAPGPLSGSYRGALNGSSGVNGRGRHHNASSVPQLQPAASVYQASSNGQHTRGGFRGRGRGGPQAHTAGNIDTQHHPAAQGSAWGSLVDRTISHSQPQHVPMSNDNIPQNGYNAVPPPPELDARGRGRGRARYRGGAGGRGARGGRGGGHTRGQGGPTPGPLVS